MKKWILYLVLAGGTWLFTTGINKANTLEELKSYTYPESKFINIEGTKVHYRDTGSGNQTLFLMHGVSSSLHTWEVWQEELSKEYRVISIDVPAFGLTGPFEKGDYSLEHYMTFLDQLLPALGVEKCVLVGSSFGGNLAWRYALHKADRVEKLILIDAAGFKRESSPFGFRIIESPLTSWFSQIITPKFMVAQSLYKVYGNEDKVTPELISRYHDILLRKGNRKAFTQVLNSISERDSEIDKITSIQQATLLIWGAKDELFPVSQAEKFHELLANSTLYIHPTAGHVPMEEEPYATLEVVQDFLRKTKPNN